MRWFLISLLVIVLIGCGGVGNQQRLTGTIEDGTADGQLLFWIDSSTTWAHTDTDELLWDDSDKDFSIGNGTSGSEFTFGVYNVNDFFRIKPGSDLSGDAGLTIDDSQQGNVGVHTNTPKSRLDVDGSFGCDINSISTNLTLNDYYFTVIIDVDDGDRTITLPQASTCDGRIYCIKVENMEATGYTLLIDPYSSETIDELLVIILATAYSSIIIQSDGANDRWMILGSHGL